MKELHCISCEQLLAPAGDSFLFCVNPECKRHGLLTVVFKKLVEKKKKTILRSKVKKKKKKKRVKSKRKTV